VSVDRFAALLRQRSVKLKTLLMDQKFVAGIGNIYSDEILFQAGLRFDRLSDSLSPQEVRRLYRAVIEVLQDAVKYRGSTLPDEGFVDLQGRPGEYQEHHQVYGREGEPCPRTKRPIRRQRFGNRSTFFSESQV
jgi:formamidopyrimidine-DNA glycosylase